MAIFSAGAGAGRILGLRPSDFRQERMRGPKLKAFTTVAMNTRMASPGGYS